MSRTFSQLKGNCPVCSGTRRDCRKHEPTGRIHCRANILPPGWQFLGYSEISFGIYTDEDTESDFDREAYQHKLQEQKKAEQEQLQTALSIVQRDKEYRSMARRRGLMTRHRQELQQRGLSDDQIDWMHQKGIIWSWSGGKLFGISANLPGAAGQNRLRNFKGLSLAISVPSIDGLVAGCQLRPNEGGYFWASSASTGGYAPKLVNGENPIGVYHPMDEPLGQRLWLAEGFLKPQIASLRMNEVVIGAAGGQFATSPEQIKAAIAAFPDLPIVLAADGGAVANRDVMRAYQGLHTLITEQGRELQVAWWGQTTKAHGDIDEISDFESIRFIPWKQFAAIALEHGGLKDREADHQPLEFYPPEYVEKMSAAAAADWEQKQQIEAGQAEEEKAQLVTHLETKRQSALRTKVKPNAAAAAVKARAKGNDDVVVVSSHEEGIRIALELGKRVFGNASGTGQGKSEGDAKLTVEMLKAMGIDVNRKISVLPDPLNPPNEAYKEHYTLVPGRHLGTYTDPESGKKRRVKEDTTVIPFEPANCKFAGTPIFSPQLQCMACSHRHRCGTERGDGYGARFEAHEALRYPNNIMSVGRLPHPGTEDMNLLTEAWLTIDEATQVVEIAKTTHVEPIDIHRKEDQLEQESPEIAAQFKPLLDYLKAAQWQESSDFNPVHGVPLAAVRNELLDTLWNLIPADENGLIWIGDPADIPINWDELYDLEDTYPEQQRLIFGDKAEKLTQTECNRLQRLKKKQVPNPENDQQWRVLEAKLEQAGKLNQDDRKALNLYRSNYLSQDEEYELAELSERHEATKFQPPSPAELRNKSAQVTKPWMSDYLQVVTGTVPGNITFNADGSFDITIKNEHHTDAIAAAKYVELMSADLPRTNAAVAQQFGCDADEIFLFEVAPEKLNSQATESRPRNVKRVQIASIGSMSRQRGGKLEEAKCDTVAELERRNPRKYRHYDIKGFQRHKTHFIENSSDNEPYEARVAAISMTVPHPNMGGVLSEYCTLTGKIVGFDDPGYQEYYQEKIKHLIEQTEGRFRAQWRSNEELTLYLFCDKELPVEVDEVISASTITEKAAVGREVLFSRLPRAIAGIAIEGGKLTQKAVAVALGCTQARVSQICAAIPGGWKIFKAIFCQLFGISQSADDGNINSSIEQYREIYKTEIPPAELDDFIQFVTAIVEMYNEGTYSAEEVVKEVVRIALNVGSKLWQVVSTLMPSELRSQLQSIVLEVYSKLPEWLGVQKE